MESCYATVGTILAVLVVLFYFYYKKTFSVFKNQGISGPTPLPFIGTVLAVLRKPAFYVDVDWCKKYGKVFGTFDGHQAVLNVTDLDFLKAVFIKEFPSFMDRRVVDFSNIEPSFNSVLTSLEGEKWKAARNALSPIFTSGKLKGMLPLMSNVGSELSSILEDMAEKDEDVEIKNFLSRYTMDVTAACGFGIKINSLRDPNEPFAENARNIMTGLGSWKFLILIVFPKILKYISLTIFDRKAMKFFRDSIESIIREKRESKRYQVDFIQLMMEAQEEEEGTQETTTTSQGLNKKRPKVLSADAVIGQSLQFFFAGFETVAATIAFMAYSLAVNPEVQEKLLQEIDETIEKHGDLTYDALISMKYLDMVFNESMRMYPAAFRLERKCVKDYQYGDIKIPKGMVVVAPVYAIHHNEEYYPDPEQFIPERFSENKSALNTISFLSFGSGPRNCIGMRLAIMECKVAIVQILRKMSFVTCSKTEVPLVFKSVKLGLTPDNGIWLRVQKRS